MPARSSSRLSRLLGQQAGPWLVAVLAVAVIWASLAFHLLAERAHDERAAIESIDNLARGFGEHINRTIEGVDQVLRLLRNAYAADPAGFDLAKLTPAAETLNGLTLQISAVNRSGVMTMSNLPMASRLDLSDREHIKTHFNTTADELFISRPVLGRVSNKWSVQFTRKLFDPEGSFAGVLIVSLDPYYLSQFYESLDIGKGEIMLVGLGDGIIRARAPLPVGAIGSSFNEADMALIRRGAVNGNYRSNNASDGIERIYGFHRLDRLGLAVVVGFATEDVFDAYHNDVVSLSVAAMALSLMVALISGALARSRHRLLASQAGLSATLENISQGIIMVDEAGRVPVINRRAVELLGLPGWTVKQGLRFHEILDWQLAQAEFQQPGPSEIDVRAMAQAGGLMGPSVYERTRPNAVDLEIRTQPLVGGGAVRTYTDITERRRTQRALEAARDVAEAASKARSEFLAMVSHEIRTPLNGVIGLAGLLMDGELAAEQRRFAELLRDAAATLLRIINDILDFSKLEADGLEFEEIAFDLEEVVSSVVSLLGLKAAAKSVVLSADIQSDLPRRLMGDPGRLRQVLLNLVDNGLKFTEHGSVTIGARLKAISGDMAWIGFTVSDTGIGIPLEAQASLFQPFAQVDGSIFRRFGGTGLGLAISRQLVERMGGDITIRSEVGKGTVFLFDVSMAIAPSALAENPVDAAPPSRRLRILLAEDNATNRLVAVSRLELMGHRVDAVANGVEAVTAVGTVPYDLVLMDVMMPVMDGLSATRAIRATAGSAAQIPIVALTANVSREQEQDCLKSGMDDFLGKPISRDHLAAIVDKAIAGTLRLVRAPAPMAPSVDPRVWAALVHDLGPAGAGALLAIAIAEADEKISSLRRELAKGFGPGMATGANGLRHAAATIGFTAVAGIAGRMAKTATSDEYASALQEVEDAFVMARQEARRICV
jgi:signal transduction histidine kinase/DNA-binding NarL/FixJ family response regulator